MAPTSNQTPSILTLNLLSIGIGARVRTGPDVAISPLFVQDVAEHASGVRLGHLLILWMKPAA